MKNFRIHFLMYYMLKMLDNYVMQLWVAFIQLQVYCRVYPWQRGTSVQAYNNNDTYFVQIEIINITTKNTNLLGMVPCPLWKCTKLINLKRWRLFIPALLGNLPYRAVKNHKTHSRVQLHCNRESQNVLGHPGCKECYLQINYFF